MRSILFVITTQENMGDLALCQEWIGDLGREECRFAFAVSSNLTKFIDKADTCFEFQPWIDVGDTILQAATIFRPDAVILASNSFWGMRNQCGAKFGQFPEQLYRLGVPLLSFDPFEIGFSTRVPHANRSIEFAPVPPGVWSLRYMSRSCSEPKVRHFCTHGVFAKARAGSKEETLRKWGADPAKKTVVFPVSENRFQSIMKSFPLYYLHLARLFSFAEFEEVQFLIISPRPIPGLLHAPNIVHLPHVPFSEFLEIVAASDVYLSDSLISCMVNGFHMGVPVMLLSNSAESSVLAPGTFLDGKFFPYHVFPYGFSEVCEELIRRFEIRDCFVNTEVLNEEEFRRKLAGLLFNTAVYQQIAERCLAWKDARLRLPRPRQVLDEILASSSAAH